MKRRKRVMLNRETIRNLLPAEQGIAVGGAYTETQGEECSGPCCTRVTISFCFSKICTVP